MIQNIENRIVDLKYITSKLKLTLSLFIHYLLKGNVKRSDDEFNKFLSYIEDEPVPIARSKRLHESVKYLLKYSENEMIREKTRQIIDKMEPSYFYLDAEIEKLDMCSNYEEKTNLIKEIGIVDKDIKNFFNINFLLSLFKIFNPKNKKRSYEFEIDQNSFDTIYKKFITKISKIGNEVEIEDLFDLAFKNIDLIKLKTYREEALRNVINNYYQLSNKLNDSELDKQIFIYSKANENPTYWAETLYNYSINLKKEKKIETIWEILNTLINKIEDIKGEFSRAVLLRESLRVLTSLNEEKKVIEYIEKIEAINNTRLGHFSSLLVKIQLIKTLYDIKKIEESRNILKEVIRNAFLINEDELFINACQRIIKIFPKIKKLIDNDLVEYFILKICELKNSLLKVHLLLLLAEKIKENQEMIEKINQMLENLNEIYFSHNIIYYDHIYPISKFILMRRFERNDELVLSDLDSLFNKIRSQTNKCYFLLEAIRQFRMRHQSEQLDDCLIKFFKELDKIRNEFEKKEVMVKYIELF